MLGVLVAGRSRVVHVKRNRWNSDISVRMRHGIVVKYRFLTDEPQMLRAIKDGRE